MSYLDKHEKDIHEFFDIPRLNDKLNLDDVCIQQLCDNANFDGIWPIGGATCWIEIFVAGNKHEIVHISSKFSQPGFKYPPKIMAGISQSARSSTTVYFDADPDAD